MPPASRWRHAASALCSHDPIKNGLLHVQPVLRLIENSLSVRLERFVVDLLAALRGQAMHDERAGLGEVHEFAIDLVSGQFLDALLGLRFLSH